MINELAEIIKTNYGYKIVKNRKTSIIKKIVSMIFLSFIGIATFFINIGDAESDSHYFRE